MRGVRGQCSVVCDFIVFPVPFSLVNACKNQRKKILF